MKYDIAHQLDLLYDYMYRRLVDANIKKTAQSLKKFWLRKGTSGHMGTGNEIAKQQNSRTAQVAK